MAAGGRGQRTEVDGSSLNNVERLILCQAVYEYGSDSWPEVARVLSTHPMILRPKLFNAQTCSVIYTHLMEEAQFECSDTLAVRHAPVHKQLAGIHWQRRVEELKSLIAAEEARFKTLVAEIDDIRAGRWDDKIRSELGLPHTQSASPPAEETPAIEANIEREERPAAVDMEVDKATGDQVLTEPPPEPDVEEAKAVQDVSESVLTSVDLSSPPKATEKQTYEISHEAEEPRAIDLPIENNAEAIEEADLTRQPDEVQEEDVVMTIEHKTPRPAEAVSPKTAQEEEPVQMVEEVEDAAEAQTVQLEEQPPPSPVESPETALADMIEDTTQAIREESAVTTPAPDEAQRSEGKRKATDLDEYLSDSQRDKKRPRGDSEPVDDEDATSSAGPRRRIGRPPAVDNPVVSKRFQNMIGMLHSQISQHRYGNIFHNPIRKADAPDYHDIVKRPMDLKTIKSRIKDGLISNSLEFQRDVYLMFANAMMYNRPGSDVYHMAEEMMQESEAHINTFRQTEGFHRM